MRNSVHYFERCKDRNGKQRLLVIGNERKFPTDENCQRDDEDEAAEEVADGREGMSPLSRRGDAPDSALLADGRADDDKQDDVHADA